MPLLLRAVRHGTVLSTLPLALLALALSACARGSSDGGSAGPSLSAVAGENSIDFHWKADSAWNEATIWWSTESGVAPGEGNALETEASPATLGGLPAGVPIHAVLAVSAAGGKAAQSSPVSTTPLPPGALGSTQAPPSTPQNVVATAGDGSVSVSWDLVHGATGYAIYWNLTPTVSPQNGFPIPGVTPPLEASGLPNGITFYFVVTAVGNGGESPPSATVAATPQAATPGNFPFVPTWADQQATSVFHIAWNPSLSNQENGLALKDRIETLKAGDKLYVGAGTWGIKPLFSINAVGTAQKPIWIEAEPGTKPVITRPDPWQNVINFGVPNKGPKAEYVCLRGFEIEGGSQGIKIYQASNLWIDQNVIHDTGDGAIAANSNPTSYLYLTRNEIYNTNGYGEGMYLGGNNSTNITHHSVVAGNYVHHTGGWQGDGIELKQGSYANLIIENVVHDTPYPCIIAYGTDGKQQNVIERNIAFNSGDNVMQVQGEAIVLNNFLANGSVCFHSHDHQGTTQNMQVVHNTMLNVGKTTNLSSWTDRPSMVLANNVVYSVDDFSIHFQKGSSGVTVTGNVVLGPTFKCPNGWTTGSGAGDFVSLNWGTTMMDGTPAAGGAIYGTGDFAWEAPDDITGAPRKPPLEAGAFDAN